jgi:hypothetical protein
MLLRANALNVKLSCGGISRQSFQWVPFDIQHLLVVRGDVQIAACCAANWRNLVLENLVCKKPCCDSTPPAPVLASLPSTSPVCATPVHAAHDVPSAE